MLENFYATHFDMPLTAEINVALRKEICQKIGSERAKQCVTTFLLYNMYVKVILLK